MKPVNEIRTATDCLSRSYQDLTKAEMEQLQQQISTNSETITNLIDQTLITSSGEEKNMIEG
jgi:light-regulated signal transduction histidine kinase (bacteriophytochrome)